MMLLLCTTAMGSTRCNDVVGRIQNDLRLKAARKCLVSALALTLALPHTAKSSDRRALRVVNGMVSPWRWYLVVLRRKPLPCRCASNAISRAARLVVLNYDVRLRYSHIVEAVVVVQTVVVEPGALASLPFGSTEHAELRCAAAGHVVTSFF